jgi:hypothetical protein
MEWDDDSELQDEEPIVASAEGIIIALECADCGGYFEGLWNETVCPSCKEGNSILEQLLARSEPFSAEAEEEFYAYRVIEYTRGWLHTRIELNINAPAPSWKEQLHEMMRKHGYLSPHEGGWKYRYPVTLGDYMALLTLVSSKRLNPFTQLCVVVRFWRTEFKYVKLTVYENGKYKIIDHDGPWRKEMRWGKEDVMVDFKPFNPISFVYGQPDNKGFRAMIDIWKNTKEGGVDALIQKALDEVFG